MVIAMLLISLAGITRTGAVVSGGPLLTNAVEKEQQRIMQDYRAEQSKQEKQRVAKLRYEQKQQRRAAILAGMEAQLHAEQQLVVLPPRAAIGSDAPPSSIWHFPPLLFAILAVILLAAGIFLKYLRSQQNKTPS
jgi:hypothetical protein